MDSFGSNVVLHIETKGLGEKEREKGNKTKENGVD